MQKQRLLRAQKYFILNILWYNTDPSGVEAALGIYIKMTYERSLVLNETGV